MSCAFKKCLNPLEMYSPPLSDRNTLILCSDCVSTSALNSLNFSKHSPLNFNKYTHTFLEKSSMYVTKYLAPPKDVVLMGPHTFECTMSKGLVARIPSSLGNGLQCCFPSMLLSQIHEDVGQGMFPRFIPLTMFRSACTPLTFKWPRRWCQSSNAPSIIEVWATLATCTSHTLVKVTWYKLLSLSAIAITFHQMPSQCTHSCSIALCTHLTRFCSPKASWHAILAQGAHPWF